jgi:riboflavin kinase/FMN adenylyltransferase
MLHYWSLENIHLQRTWLTIGSFDGVHLGHQAILERIVAGARRGGNRSVVLTFHPHPAVILGKRQGAFYLTSPEEKAEYLDEKGVDCLITHPFNRQVASLSAREFVSRLHGHLGFTRLCVGNDFALGRNREGNIPALKLLGDELGFEVEVMPAVTLDQKVVSSSWVRNALAEGDLATVERLLGRPFRVSGEVIHGDGRGKSLGFPTANMEIWEEHALPMSGVYACWARIEGEEYPAVTNVGFRPTFENQPTRPQVETHLLDFDQNLYHRRISLSFLTFLRGEQRFASVQDLVDQVQKDIQRARTILEVSRHETIPGIT